MSTRIGYKLFRILKSRPGELFPLYVNASESIPIGEWVKAKSGERTDEGKVKSKLGPLKFRPGFHINDNVPYVSHIGIKENGSIAYMRNNVIWCEVEYRTDIDYSSAARLNGIKNGKLNPVKACLDYIPVNGYYKYKTSPMMNGEWIISGEIKVNRILSDDEVISLCKINNSPYLPRKFPLDICEYGFAV